MRVLFLSLLILSALTSISLARYCTPKDMLGTWQRVSKNLKDTTYWIFTLEGSEQSSLPDGGESGIISCTGDCNRAAGPPESYKWTKLGMVTVKFEKYSLEMECCRSEDFLVLRDFDGGGKLTFREQ